MEWNWNSQSLDFNIHERKGKKRQRTSKEKTKMFFKTGELFLKTTLKNWKKTCLNEFRQCCEIKVVIPNILFQGRIIRIRTVC